MTQKRKSLLGSFFKVLVERPGHLWSYFRAFMLFGFARLLRDLIFRDPRRVAFGRNVRLQKNRSLFTDSTGSIEIGDHSIIYEKAKLSATGPGRITIGECSVLGDIGIYSRSEVRIGKRFLSSWNVFIQDYDPHPVDPVQRRLQMEQICYGFHPRFGTVPPAPVLDWEAPSQAILIGDDVWVGANATILKGARIGSGSIVASGAVVLKGDYPERSVLAGNPAREIKRIGLP